MPETSPFDVLVEAFRDAKSQMAEATKLVRTDIVAPADPNATRLSPADRHQDYLRLVQDPAYLESEFLRLKDRYKLPQEKPIPRRLVEFLKEQYKVDKAEQAKQPTRPSPSLVEPY
jgi:hypothetical protein